MERFGKGRFERFMGRDAGGIWEFHNRDEKDMRITYNCDKEIVWVFVIYERGEYPFIKGRTVSRRSIDEEFLCM